MPTQLQTRPVRSSGVSIPDTLNRYLSANSRDDLAGTTQYVDGGAELVTQRRMRAGVLCMTHSTVLTPFPRRMVRHATVVITRYAAQK